MFRRPSLAAASRLLRPQLTPVPLLRTPAPLLRPPATFCPPLAAHRRAVSSAVAVDPSDAAESSSSRADLCNVAIVAHVDHGKTTLVDALLQATRSVTTSIGKDDRLMDGNDQEKERGITILAKNAAVRFKDVKINIVDTPGHADFGGEVERANALVA